MLQRFQQGSIDVFQLGERLTLDECEAVRTELLAALPVRIPYIVLDLRKLRLIDSAGLELLCDIQSLCSQRGGSVRLAACSPLIADVLRITGLDLQFSQHHDAVAAAGAFAL